MRFPGFKICSFNFNVPLHHDNGQLYIIMELVEGASLLDFITSAG
jgi:hypothetical protein